MSRLCNELFRNILFLINFVLAITGLALAAFGAYVKFNADQYLDFMGTGYANSPIFVIVFGLVISMIAFFGCCGACTESPRILYTYTVILGFILIAEVGAVVAAYVLRFSLEAVLNKEVTNNMKVGMKNYNRVWHDEVTDMWDLVQQDLRCCGVDGLGDWSHTPYRSPPDSCCVGEEHEKYRPYTGGCTKYKRGCLNLFKDQFLSNVQSNIGIVGGVLIGIAVVQFLGALVACCLGMKIQSDQWDETDEKRYTT